MLASLALLVAVGPALSQDLGALPDRARLDAAIELYLAGDTLAARDDLLLLVNDPELTDPDLQREARVWLGQVEYTLGNRDAAESAFLVVARTWPDYRMDPYEHPPAVVAFFDAVRSSVGPAPVLPEEPLPPVVVAPPALANAWLLYPVPGGFAYLDGRPAVGAATTSTVLLLGASSVGMRAWLVGMDGDRDLDGIQVDTSKDPDALARARTVRTVQHSMAWTALAIWGTTSVTGVLRRQAEGVALQVGPGGVEATVHW